MPALLQPTPDGFLRCGARHLIVSGAMHYFRIHPAQWRDRLRRLVALGCDTVETYVAWNVHQPAPGETTFEGIADLGRFLDLAAEEGLDAIVRPGPYICAEWENGGFPGWLLADRNLRLRHRDPAYLAAVDAWFDQLIPVIAERQASRGGNVVMVQVENEYGSYGDDAEYLAHLRDGLRARGIDELLVTSDGPARMWLTGGTVDGALATVNFGSRTAEVLEMAARELPGQPQMCMEFWNGWFDHWGEEHHARPADDAAGELATMLERGMSVNLYMAHGGTNFGLTAGANHNGSLQPTTTSYDYDAPIAENGALTGKFRAFREVIAAHRDLPPLEEHLAQLGLEAEPGTLPAGPVEIEKVVSLRDTPRFTRDAPVHPVPPAFEDLGLERGLLRLSRELEIARSSREDGPAIAPLKLYDLHDRAWVYVDGHYAGATGLDPAQAGVPHAERTDATDPAVLDLSPLADVLLPDGGHRTVRVEILVENLGRTNFGPRLGERKGILGGVWHTIRFHNDWQADPWPLEEMGEELAGLLAGGAPLGAAGDSVADGGAADGGVLDDALPVLVGAAFTADAPADTYLDVSGAGHGVAYVNGFCVGRYWNIGPQQTLYVPAPLVREGRNEVLLLDLERRPTGLALAEGHRFGRAGAVAGPVGAVTDAAGAVTDERDAGATATGGQA
ncbi:glycoside hydrolase family 35 protein [Brachybacterium aquaticum]|uniref:Beta-galactosidase n=1 Tax=Brachybacterium aquaticum TaxID=1432564 RepID=A0A841AH33_9MICO|nr:beta-galactosidase family protein [Brachybacterium aquaticum]MBB5832600.1 beta-galactosidase [Brachybacterium aquaticum]